MDVKNLLNFPKRLITLWNERDLIAKELTEAPTFEWCLSDAGKAAFENAKTPVQRILFFYDYLCTVCSAGNRGTLSAESKEHLYKTAYIMSEAVYGTSLEYGSYPAILDESKNPMILSARAVAKSNKLSTTVIGAHYLMDMFGMTDLTKNEARPFEQLEYCEENKEMSEIYKIQRYILGLFCTDFDDKFKFLPYFYDIVDSNIKSNDASDDE